MIKIGNEVIKQQHNFWNHCIFHPTDAVEDPWGKRILDQISEDKACGVVRIYAMFEDIFYLDGEGNMQCDFRLNDLRLDYLLEKGFTPLIAYGFIPEWLASDKSAVASVAKNKTRYKGKMINTSIPNDYSKWEEMCYLYTKHIVERYGVEEVSKWYAQCHNEPDSGVFFIKYKETHKDLKEYLERQDYRVAEYCKLYTGFNNGILKVTDKLKFGGPVTAHSPYFLGKFLDYVKDNGLHIDFMAVHDYGTGVGRLNSGTRPVSVKNSLEVQEKYCKVVKERGFEDTPFIVDEWGASSAGFYNMEECPSLIFRETEIFSSYYVRLIADYIKNNYNVEKMLICLSGQHEMTEDFTGFRNFFTLNFIRKPIYNAYCLAAKLHEGLLEYTTENENVFAVPTNDENGNLAVLLTYCGEYFEEDLSEIEESVTFEENIIGKSVTIWCIDKSTTNPYRLAQSKGIGKEPTQDEITLLREEGKLKPIATFKATENFVKLNLTANATYLITME